MTDPLTLARHHLQTGSPNRALDALSRADVELTDTAGFWVMRSAARLSLEQWGEAADDASHGLELEPESVELLTILAEAHAQRGDLAAAEVAILAALRTNSDDPELICQYADIVARGGQVDKAVSLVDRAAALDAQSPAVLLARAELAYLRGDNRTLKAASAELLARDPDSLVGHHMRGVAMSASGHAHAAARHYATVAARSPDQERAVEQARDARFATHPALLPLWPMYRFGPWVAWGIAVALILGLRSAGAGVAATVVAVIWIALCMYSWVVPPILERVSR